MLKYTHKSSFLRIYSDTIHTYYLIFYKGLNFSLFYSKRFTNYGTTVPNPIFENGKLYMRLSSNQTCPADKNKTITSIIDFVCDKDILVSKYERQFAH